MLTYIKDVHCYTTANEIPLQFQTFARFLSRRGTRSAARARGWRSWSAETHANTTRRITSNMHLQFVSTERVVHQEELQLLPNGWRHNLNSNDITSSCSLLQEVPLIISSNGIRSYYLVSSLFCSYYIGGTFSSYYIFPFMRQETSELKNCRSSDGLVHIKWWKAKGGEK